MELKARTLRLGLPPPSPSRKPSRTRIKISWKSADPGRRQVRLCPSKAERGKGDVGAPTGAVHYFIDEELLL